MSCEINIFPKDPCPCIKINPLSTYLHIIWRQLIAGSLEGLGNITKDLHRRQQVTSIEVPPLGEVKQIFRHLGHPIPCQHPLALCKVTLNLQKQEKTELGALVSLKYAQSCTFWINGAKKNLNKDSALRGPICDTDIEGELKFILDVLKRAIMNKRADWSRTHF